MRTAVVRVNVDPFGVLTPSGYQSGVEQLRRNGIEVVHTPATHLPERDRLVELIVDDAGLEHRGQAYASLCAEVFGTPCALGVVTFISRGTDDDALGILAGFGLDGAVERDRSGEQEFVTVTVAKAEMRRVPESRLHTAMEAALNCEVRIVCV